MVHRHDSLPALENTINHAIDAGRLNQALKLIHNAVFQVISEPVCTAQAFSCRKLDELCLKIGQICLKQEHVQHAIHTPPADTPTILYLVTKLQKSGGHTRVLRDFILAQPEYRHIVLVTGLDGASDKNFLPESLPSQINYQVDYAPKDNFLHKLVWLQSRLKTLYPAKKTYLFNHHQDSVIIAAIQPEIVQNPSFYHHGDHHLCLGASLTTCEHIDIHATGFQQCRNNGVQNTYIPLFVADKGDRASSHFLEANTLTTCTAARTNKIEKPYPISYAQLIPDLLKSTEGTHIHIGTLTSWYRWKIKRKMKQLGIAPERFIYLPWVSDLWRTLQQKQVDLYITSFPYGGGLTLIEAMGAGIPVAIHRHMFSRLLSCTDLAYPEAFSWHAPEELIQYCQMVNAEILSKSSRAGRQHYLDHYQNNQLSAILKGEKTVQVPDPEGNFSVQEDEYAYWLSGQFSLLHLLRNMIYRLAKRIRARLYR